MAEEQQMPPAGDQAPAPAPEKPAKKGICKKCPCGLSWPWCTVCIVIVIAIIYFVVKAFI